MPRSIADSAWLVPLALAACSSNPFHETPQCGFDGGGPIEATAEFVQFLDDAGRVGCLTDSDCILVQTPCHQSFEECQDSQFTQVAVPIPEEAAAEALASQLTAELCPASCTTEPDQAPVDGNICEIPGTLAAICVPNGLPDGGTCVVGEAPFLDAGQGNFEAYCGFGCSADEFCDISSIESLCPDGGVYEVPTNGQGVCAPVFAPTTSCTTDSQCSMESACVDPVTQGPCNSAACQDGGGVCKLACPIAEPSCPASCGSPLDDGRHCVICACGGTCPP